jgi:hypothetical protein
MSEAAGTGSLIYKDGSTSSLFYLNVADRLRLMSAATKSPEARQQLVEIVEAFEKLKGLCSSFENLKPRISITGPILPD